MSFWRRLYSLFSASSPGISQAHLADVQEILGYYFRNIDLLSLALTHRSAANHGANGSHSNERLEFLGDSVLGLVIADRLYDDNPDMSEGDLTKTKAMLVNETTLAAVAIEVGLNMCVLMSPEEIRSGGRERNSIIADAFEAVIGAVYLDGGYHAARDVVLRLIYVRRDRITRDASQRNFKGDLLELIQARGEGMPHYDIVSERGPDHAKEFQVRVTVGGQTVGEGVGFSKKEAEQKAAAVALEYFQTHQLDD
ncbi:MAG: ribonuclease III [candidate division Zixibacteria bacterium]|jgi:ribonuclease-3|nr:ribonuclease III [candidate division Zixibacteria bacterium]